MIADGVAEIVGSTSHSTWLHTSLPTVHGGYTETTQADMQTKPHKHVSIEIVDTADPLVSQQTTHTTTSPQRSEVHASFVPSSLEMPGKLPKRLDTPPGSPCWTEGTWESGAPIAPYSIEQ
eukprot:TRINITY_DN11859_c0_g1_i2.p1 TRINITY_DN11859_c0_g1~~TRINITY_DN11859_c0_g1_i2.p1  ORF type:complete len:121 (-),score=14.26 TRINITY_DN11859_c0_g1_i2:74-436(-)